MKKTLKIVLPVLLVLALLVTGYWFFFQYRADLTAGMLERLGDGRMEAGKVSSAIRCYRWANSLMPDDAELALKLAQAYRQDGNYTKTESTLVHAIYGAPQDIRLYKTLSQVYVEQDKLLDAQQMLDQVADPQVREALEQARPAAPELNPPGDFYSEYISLEISTEPGARCCYSLDGTSPSVSGAVYEAPFSLGGGRTLVRAVAVSEDGLVSPETQAEYTVAGVIEDVSFHDPALEQALRELLDRESRAIRTDDLWSIEELVLPEGLTDGTDLNYFTGLTKLTGRNLGELDYSFLASMPELRYLELDGCVVTTGALEQIAACENLDVLILADCGLSNLAPLETMRGLRVLDLSDNSITSITPLTPISSLDELYLGHNALRTLPVLRGLKALRILDLSYNALDYVGTLNSCPTLQRLNLSHNRLSSIKAVGELPELVWLNASNNSITEVDELAACTKLESFIFTDNKLTSIDFMEGFQAIQEINIDYNDVEAVPALAADCALTSFSAAHNFLEDLSGLAGLPNLNYVNADYNNIRDISVLKNCPVLAQVNVYGTYIRSAGVLGEQGVVVNFTPGF